MAQREPFITERVWVAVAQPQPLSLWAVPLKSLSIMQTSWEIGLDLSQHSLVGRTPLFLVGET